ncbi:fimbrial protein [Cronobacter dublinensis]|uniref:fimbrial protein n=1 Tax=Cronobacter dublinensis TaxID=413497 RepID=UPI00300DCC3D
MKNKKPRKVAINKQWRRILQCVASIFLFWLSHPVLAFTCTGPYGTISTGGGQANVTINVTPQFEPGENIVVDLNQIRCTNDYGDGTVDTLYISDQPPSTVAQLQPLAGLEISGVNYSLASSTGKLVLPGFTTGSRTIPVRFFIYLDQKIIRPVSIKKGDLILSIKFRQTSTADGTWYQTWNFFSNNDTDVYSTTCKINGGNVIDVNYQSVIVTDVKPYASQSITREVPLHFNCDNKNYSSPVKITLSAAAAGQYDENGAFLTSTTGLGITMLHNGSVVPVNGSFSSVITNGQGSDNVSFALVKQNASTRLATGAFQASASLIMETE